MGIGKLAYNFLLKVYEGRVAPSVIVHSCIAWRSHGAFLGGRRVNK